MVKKVLMSIPVNSEALSPDEITANEVLAPFDIQIVRLRGEFTLRGNLTGLEAAYLHTETVRQIPTSVVDEIRAFGERRERLLAECLDAHSQPAAAEVDEVGDLPAPPTEVVAKCTAKVNAHFGLRNEGSLLDVLHRAKGPDAELHETR